MRVYISGAITGINDYRERFADAEEKLKTAGHIPINPVRLSDVLLEMIPDAKYSDFMEIDLAALGICDAIYQMPGSENSRGANREYVRAQMLQKKVVEL